MNKRVIAIIEFETALSIHELKRAKLIKLLPEIGTRKNDYLMVAVINYIKVRRK